MAKKINKATAKLWAKEFKGKGKGANSVMFPKAQVLELLSEPNCEGLRIYNAFDPSRQDYPFTMFLVGTDKEGKALLPSTEDRVDIDPYSIEDDGKTCPPSCNGTLDED